MEAYLLLTNKCSGLSTCTEWMVVINRWSHLSPSLCLSVNGWWVQRQLLARGYCDTTIQYHMSLLASLPPPCSQTNAFSTVNGHFYTLFTFSFMVPHLRFYFHFPSAKHNLHPQRGPIIVWTLISNDTCPRVLFLSARFSANFFNTHILRQTIDHNWQHFVRD